MNIQHSGGLCLVAIAAYGGLLSTSQAQTGTDGHSAALTQTAYVKASNAGPGDQFGSGGTLEGASVALSGDGRTLAVGAPLESSGATGINGDQEDESAYGAGAVYVFASDGAGWSQQAYVKASNTGLGDHFGFVTALSADGDTLAVSAVYESSSATGVNGDQHDDSLTHAGAVYVFTRDGANWSQQAYIKASNTAEAATRSELGNGDQFGFSIALSADGNTLAVGAITEDGGTPGINRPQTTITESAGAVYVFTRTGSRWEQQAYIKTSNPGASDYFGYSVALSANGDTLAAGAYDEDGSLAGTNERQDDDLSGAGAVYVFERRGAEWSQTAYVKAANAENSDSLGVAVALSEDGNTLVAAALDEDGMGTGVNPTPVPDQPSDVSTGAVYAYAREPSGWVQKAYIKASNTGANDLFGGRLALSGDGRTLAVGAQLEDGGATGINGNEADDSAEEAGAVYYFRRSADTWAQTAYVKASNNEAYDEFGSAVALSRDGSVMAVGARGEDSDATGLNGDQSDNTADEAGAVYLFRRE